MANDKIAALPPKGENDWKYEHDRYINQCRDPERGGAFRIWSTSTRPVLGVKEKGVSGFNLYREDGEDGIPALEEWDGSSFLIYKLSPEAGAIVEATTAVAGGVKLNANPAPGTSPIVYLKDTIDTTISTINASISTIQTTVSGLSTSLGSLSTSLSSLTTALGNKADTSTVNSALAAKADDTAVVKLTGNQTVAGVKTFSSAIVAEVDTPVVDIAALSANYTEDATTAGDGKVIKTFDPNGSDRIVVLPATPRPGFGRIFWHRGSANNIEVRVGSTSGTLLATLNVTSRMVTAVYVSSTTGYIYA